MEPAKQEKKEVQLPLYQSLSLSSIVPKMGNLLKPGGGWYIDEKDKKIKARGALDPFRPWVYFYPPGVKIERFCVYFRDILWLRFGIFPSYCREKCHKTVVRPMTVVEMIRLYDLMCDLNYEAKIGTEKRQLVPYQYGAYFYTNNMEAALDRKKELQKLVGKHVGHKIQISAKKACTEMELKYGPSDKWPEMTKQEREREEQICSIIEAPISAFEQPQWLKNDIILSWFDHAWENGDMTVLQFTGNEPLVPPAKTY